MGEADDRTMKARIVERAGELGFSHCGIASADGPDPVNREAFEKWVSNGDMGTMDWMERGKEKRMDPQLILPGVQSVVVVAQNYLHLDQPAGGLITDPSGETGVFARYAWYRDYHDFVGERLKLLADYIDELSGLESRSLWYVDTGPVLERSYAHRAGIGFVGKHTNLISRELGNWFFLGEVLTQVRLEPDSSQPNRCGTCRRCLDACPTGALPEPFRLDARRCISYLTIEHKGSIPEEIRPLMGQRIFGCDDCLAVCPWNRFAKQSRELESFLNPELRNRPLEKWLGMNDKEFRETTRGTPLFRTRRGRFLRNVTIAMGNSRERRYLASLEKSVVQDPDELVREHAAWAIQHILANSDPEPAQ